MERMDTYKRGALRGEERRLEDILL